MEGLSDLLVDRTSQAVRGIVGVAPQSLLLPFPFSRHCDANRPSDGRGFFLLEGDNGKRKERKLGARMDAHAPSIIPAFAAGFHPCPAHCGARTRHRYMYLVPRTCRAPERCIGTSGLDALKLRRAAVSWCESWIIPLIGLVQKLTGQVAALTPS